MNKNRFRLDRAKRSFDCYDCRTELIIGSEFAWDNLRNTKICEPCLKKLSDLLEDDKTKDAAAAALAITRTDSERIAILEEHVDTLNKHILHLKSIWYNEQRTITRMTHAPAVSRLNPSPSIPSVEGFSKPLEVVEELVQKTAEHIEQQLKIDEDMPF